MPRERRRVALLVETSNSYARELLHGIRSWMRSNESWAIRLSEQSRGADVPRWLAAWKGHGIIARVENAAIADTLQATGLPVVDVSAALPEPRFPRVITDSRAVTQLAAEHLIECGFRHFGFCGDPRFLWSEQRAMFFAEYLAVRGYSCANYAPKPTPGAAARSETDVRAIARWLASLPKPVGVLACYDLRAQQVLEACRFGGLAVPDDVAVIGVHNDELLCDLCDPPLTSVIPNARRAGFVAAGLLARMMRGRAVSVRVEHIPPIGVAARQSTDIVAVAEPRIAAAVRFIREHALENLAVGDVLRAVPMSRTLFERKFKQCIGHTPREHIQRVRLEKVKALLATTDLPIGAIAERTGFEHPEYLCVMLRRATGLSPKAFRARHRSGGSTDPTG